MRTIKTAKFEDYTFKINRKNTPKEVIETETLEGSAEVFRDTKFVARGTFTASKSKNGGKWIWHYKTFVGADEVDADALKRLYELICAAIPAEIEMVKRGLFEE